MLARKPDPLLPIHRAFSWDGAITVLVAPVGDFLQAELVGHGFLRKPVLGPVLSKGCDHPALAIFAFHNT